MEEFMPSPANRSAIVLLMLSLLCACGRPPSVSGDNAANSADSQKLPFDRQPPSTGISPSHALIPSATKLPEGTAIPIRLLSALCVAAPEGSPESPLEPGYLRIVLVSLNIGGKPVMIETSSIFAKGGGRDERNSATGTASGASQLDSRKGRDKNIVLGIDRHLNFRLAQAVDLQ